jgi:hypothetical protein
MPGALAVVGSNPTGPILILSPLLIPIPIYINLKDMQNKSNTVIDKVLSKAEEQSHLSP